MKIYGEEALAALADGTAIVTGAVAIYCDPPVFVWGGHGTCAIDGDPYLGLGNRGLIKVTSGAIGGSEQNIELTLSGIDPEAAALFDGQDVRGAACKLYRMEFDSSGTRVLDCRVFKRGTIDTASRDETIGGTASITLNMETAARGLGKQGLRMRSDADQRLIDPDDGFFKHVSYAAEKVIYFGGEPSSAAALASA